MVRLTHNLCGLLVLLGGATAGCSSLLGDFTRGTAADASLDATGSSSGGGGVDAGADAVEQTADARGPDAVADSGGGDSSCTTGMQCSPAPCVSGVTVCQGGVPTCIAAGIQPSGISCDAGAVCSNGTCVACAAGASCADAGSCQTATVACATGSPTCVAGGNAQNGQSCGASVYCNSGTCGACTPDAPCAPIGNPCHTGTAVCDDGGFSCTDTGNNTTAGTACGTNMVCDGNGTCASCIANAACSPGGNPCLSGTTSCATGASTCPNPTNVADGTPCGDNMVCSGGMCNACTFNASCAPNNNSCLLGYVDCSSGASVCTQNGVAQDGTPCGSGQSCSNGTCGACTDRAPCNPGGNVCQTGTTSCAGGMSTCTSPSNAQDGTACGTNQVCSGGNCVACTTGMICTPGGNACLTGKTSCTTGSSTCINPTSIGSGVSCGMDMVCNNGQCNACTAGTFCNPGGNPCQNGATTCITGSSTCGYTSTLKDGTPCGTGLVCSSGNCVSCMSAQTCHPGGNECLSAMTDCSSGVMVCDGPTANVNPGTPCDVSAGNMVCDGNGSCVACAAGGSCTPSNPCQIGAYSCMTGAQTCVANGKNQNDGTPCNTSTAPNQVCSGGVCTQEYTLTLAYGGGVGHLWSTDRNLECGSSKARCSQLYLAGTRVTVYGTPEWLSTGMTVSPGGCASTYGPCTVVMNSDVTISDNWTTNQWDPNFDSTITTGATFSNSNLTVTNGPTTTLVRTTYDLDSYGTGVYYWEITIGQGSTTSDMDVGGLGIVDAKAANSSYIGNTPQGLGFGYGAGNEHWWNSFSGVTPQGTPSYELAAGQVYNFAFSASTGRLWIGLYGAWFNSGDPGNGLNPSATGVPNDVYPAGVLYGSTSGPLTFTANFGATPFSSPVPYGF